MTLQANAVNGNTCVFQPFYQFEDPVALSGILESQAAEVAAAYLPFFDPVSAGTEQGWALVAGVRR